LAVTQNRTRIRAVAQNRTRIRAVAQNRTRIWAVAQQISLNDRINNFRISSNEMFVLTILIAAL